MDKKKLLLPFFLIFALVCTPRFSLAANRNATMLVFSTGLLGMVGLTVYSLFSGKPEKTKLPNYNLSSNSHDSEIFDKLSENFPIHRSIGTQTFSSRNYFLKYGKASEEKSKYKSFLLDQISVVKAGTTFPEIDLGTKMGYRFVRSPSRVHPHRDGITDLILNPILGNEEGLFHQDGHQSFFGASARGELENILSYEVEPIIKLTSRLSKYQNQREFLLKRAYAKLTLNRLEISLGKDAINWGQGRYSSMLFSKNQESLPLLRLSNSIPTKLPGFLAQLGRVKMDTFIAVTNSQRKYPKSLIFGTKTAFLLHPRFELGVGSYTQFGGQGATKDESSIGNILGEGFVNNKGGNRGGLIDFRYRIPEIKWQLYSDLYYEDCCIGFPTNHKAMGILFGLYFPKIFNWNKFDLALEFVRTDFPVYRHWKYDSGFGYRGHVMGHPIGPDAKGYYAILRYFYSPELFTKFVLVTEENTYYLDKFIEIRDRLEVNVSYQATRNFYLSTEGKLELVNSFRHVSGANPTHYSLGLQVSYR